MMFLAAVHFSDTRLTMTMWEVTTLDLLAYPW